MTTTDILGWTVSLDFTDNGTVTASIVSKQDAKTKFSHPPQCLVRNISCPSTCSADRWERLDALIQYRDSDVLVVSYPKSGTTWIEQVTLLLLHEADLSLLNPATKNVYVPGISPVGKIWPESCLDQIVGLEEKFGIEFARLSAEDFDDAPAPRVIKSHAASELLLGMSSPLTERKMPGIKIIVVSRNPFDSCVSRFHHAFNPCKLGWDFDAWAAVWLCGYTSYGCWFQWVKEWSARAKSNPEQILWLQYESIQANPDAEVRRVAEFLGIPPEPELIENVVKYSSFDSMKEQSSSKGGDFQGHLRKGIVGDWRSYFSEEMKQEFVKKFHAELSGTGLVYDISNGEHLTAL
jgi:hypothetical protein